MPQESRAKQSFKTFVADINQAIQSNLLSLSETEELSSALTVVQARLNSHRNWLVPINKLPSEILARIFEFVVAPQPFHNPPIPPRPTTWNRRLVLVCTRWCAIAMKCQRMWYCIVDKDIDDLWNYSPRAVLRRSGSVIPLHLWMTSTPEPDSVSRWIIKNQPLRVEALYIHVLNETPVEVVLESLRTPLPSLRLLSVDARWEYHRVFGPDMPTILGGSALNLEALVWYLSIPFIPGNAFPNLEDLDLYLFGRDILDLDRLIRLLSNCPRLKTLVVAESALDDTSGIAHDRGLAKLDHLRAVWIHSMPVNVALTILAYLQLPTDATVRLSDLQQHYPSERVPPPIASVPFLQQMDDLIRLDVVSSGVKYYPGYLHFIAVGARSRFWIHFDGARLDVRAYVRFLYEMLPKKNLQTVRFSMQPIGDFVFIHDLMVDPLPSLNTLLVRQCAAASRRHASSAIAAVAMALCPGGPPEHDISDVLSDSDSEGSSADEYFEGPSANFYSRDDSDSDDVDRTDHPLDATQEQSLTARHDHVVHTDFPIDLSQNIPAPRLKVVGIEVQRPSTASLKPLVRMVEARKMCGYPLDTVLCSLEGADEKDVDDMKEHIVDGVSDVRDRLWVPTIDEDWLMKNDYWWLYPGTQDYYSEYEEWGFNMFEW